jgi:hypothetical protein
MPGTGGGDVAGRSVRESLSITDIANTADTIVNDTIVNDTIVNDTIVNDTIVNDTGQD